ncbi:MAG: GAF domain-containing protein [Anaerolineae bacterium]|nr:GAF domain-containing protein [Anaerolineae bacterium]
MTQVTLYVLIPLLTTLIAWGIVALAWQRRILPHVEHFNITLILIGGWTFSYALEVIAHHTEIQSLWYKLAYVSATFTPVLWYIFVLDYTGQQRPHPAIPRRLLFVLPAFTTLLIMTHEWHHLIWRDYSITNLNFLLVTPNHSVFGVWHWVQIAFSYLVTASSMVSLVSYRATAPPLYRKQTAILLTSTLIVWLCHLIYSFILPLPQLNFTHIGLVIGIGLLLGNILRYRLLNIIPLASKMMMMSIVEDAVIALDLNDYITDTNSAALTLLAPQGDTILGKRLTDMFPCEITTSRDLEITRDTQTHYYEAHVYPLYNQDYGAGRLIILRNITQRQEQQEKLTSQKRRIEELLEVAHATAETPSLETTLQNILNITITLTQAERGDILLFNKASKVTHSILALEMSTRRNLSPEEKEKNIKEMLQYGFAGWLFLNQNITRIENVSEDKRWYVSSGQANTVGSVLGIPILENGIVLAEIILLHPDTQHFKLHDTEIMRAAAPQIAIAIHNALIYEEQRQTTARQVTLYEILRALQRIRSPKKVIEQAVTVIHNLTGWPLVTFLVPDAAQTHLWVESVAGRLPPQHKGPIPLTNSIFAQTIRTTISQHLDMIPAVNDVDTDNLRQQHAPTVPGFPTVASLILIPLMKNKRVERLLFIASDMPSAFNANDHLLAESLVEILNMALANAQLYETLQNELVERNRMEERLWMTLNKTETLYRISNAVIGTYELDEVLQTLVNGVVSALHADWVLLVILDQVNQRIVKATTGGPAADHVKEISFQQLMQDMAQGVIKGNKPLLITKEQITTMAASQIPMLCAQAGSQIWAPLYSYQQIFHEEPIHGLLIACNYATQHEFSQQEANLMMAIAVQAAAAIQNTRLFNAVLEERGRLKALVQSSRDGVILIGTDLRILVINHRALRYIELTDAPEIWVGKTLWEAISWLRQTMPHVARAIVKEIRQTQPPGALEKTGEPQNTRDGELQIGSRILHWLNLPVLTEEHLLGRLIVLRDITETRLLERMREDLTHTMVHDLRSPITGIYGALQLLDKSLGALLTPAQAQMLEIAESSTERMLRLVNAILDISRLESGRMPIKPELFELNHVVTDTITTANLKAVQKEIRIEDNIPADLPPVWADADLIGRVLQNLIGNAVKFTPSGGTIHIGACKESGPPGKILVTVSDTGPGIPPELKDRLFQKFVTGELDGRGSGLGLAFCRMVMEGHNERIWVESPPGKGATFTFTLSQTAQASS